MILNNKLKDTLLYIFFEGLSKGGNTLIFLLSATILSKDEYVNLLLLFSLEGLFIILSPLYYTDVLYKLRDEYSFSRIKDNTFKIVLIYGLLLFLVFFLFQNPIKEFYNVDNFVVIVSIIFIVIFRLTFQIQSVNYQISEDHNNAIKNKAYPFLSSFVLGLFFFIFFNDKILGFFLGRFTGFLLMFMLSSRRFIIEFNLNFDYNFLLDFIKRAVNLIVIGLGGWFLGYGMLNILKEFYSQEINFNVGLMLNLWSILLLVANGINGVYFPAFRKEYLNNKAGVKVLFNKVLYLYLFVLLVILILFLFFKDLTTINFFGYSVAVNSYLNIIPFVLLIFLAQIFQYVSMPYYIVQDEFKKLSFIGIVTNFISILAIFTHHFYSNYIMIDIIWIIILSYYIKSMPIYLLKNKMV
ncbi:hypothetical protein [Tenacibaculum sp.]|uniref:hypothetical protein n=1 Tax=Tenacibaculum sp. TaxID=1906242 RepID=UPI003D0A2A2B